MSRQRDIRDRVKDAIVTSLRLEGMTQDRIQDDDPLFGEGLGLDSVDALEIVVALEKEFGIRIQKDNLDESSFASVATLAALVERLQAGGESRTEEDARSRS